MIEINDKADMREKIISFFKDIYPEAYHAEDGAYILHVKGADNVSLYFAILNELVEEGVLHTKGNQYFSYVHHDYNQSLKKEDMIGIYKGFRKSFGFVTGENIHEDIFVSEDNRHGAMHNDTVRVSIMKGGKGDKKREGKITEILERANHTVVGTFDRQKINAFVTPDDERLGKDIYIPLEHTMDARSGAKVVVEIVEWPTQNRLAEGKVIAVIGYEGDQGLDVSLIMAKYNIPLSFPCEVQKESDTINMCVSDDGERLDLRDEELITIDGEDAKDLDDAVSIHMTENGLYRLGVHIADVSHYVKSQSAIDKEAYKRGTSVYLADRVVPMLPPILSNEVCSLRPNVDRYAMSCIMDIDKEGTVHSYRITPSIIKVSRRCSYREVYQALVEDIIGEDLKPHIPLLQKLQEVAFYLNEMRKRRGAIDFDFPEYKVLLNKEGTPLRIVKKERTIAERIIEECMLIANETVSTHLSKKENTSVYRIHEVPSAEKVERLQNVLNHLGVPLLFKKQVQPKDFQDFLGTVAHTDLEQVAYVMTLRSMQQAKYSIHNVGHFGLASSCYTHFTSPIRRYPDLMIHRLLKKDMQWKDGYSKRDSNEEFLNEATLHSSVAEQNAVAAEREVDDLKKAQYMLPFVGEPFTGTVSSITSFGMFVALSNGIDGLVPLSSMVDDFYVYDEKHVVLIGRHSGTTYHLGQEVTVTLTRVDVDRKQIDFALGELKTIHDHKKPKQGNHKNTLGKETMLWKGKKGKHKK